MPDKKREGHVLLSRIEMCIAGESFERDNFFSSHIKADVIADDIDSIMTSMDVFYDIMT